MSVERNAAGLHYLNAEIFLRGIQMQIVIDTVDEDGRYRAMVVEALACDEEVLTARKGKQVLRVAVSRIVDWALIEEQEPPLLPLDNWIPRRPTYLM
jgi:hypothetical protein